MNVHYDVYNYFDKSFDNITIVYFCINIMHHVAFIVSKTESHTLLLSHKVNPSVKWFDVLFQIQLAHANTRTNTKNGSA